MKRILTLLLLTLSLGVFSQEILLQQNVRADSVRPTYGPNLKNFLHGYIGLGFPLKTNESMNYTRPGFSSSFNVGIRYKRKITSYIAVGLDVGLTYTAFKIKQEFGKTVPDTIQNKKEKFQINSGLSSAYLRINLGRRGNYIGNYLDLGAFGGLNLVKKHKTTNINADGEKVRVLTNKLKYIDNYSYGFIGRIGTSRYALTASYRLSDMFKPTYAMPDLPRLIIGIEVGLIK